MLRFLIATVLAGLLGAGEIQPVRRGKLLFEDDFSGGPAVEKGWRIAKGKWEKSDGKLHGVELAADKHAAVVRHNVAFRDAVIEVSFRLAPGAKMAAVSLNSAKGHSCRVTIRPDQMIVQKDRTNAKSDDKAEVLARKAMTFEPNRWYTLTMELRGKQLQARIDDGPPIGGEHPALEIDRVNVGLPALGEGAWFDHIRVWEAR